MSFNPFATSASTTSTTTPTTTQQQQNNNNNDNPAVVVFRDSDLDASITNAAKKVYAIPAVAAAMAAARDVSARAQAACDAAAASGGDQAAVHAAQLAVDAASDVVNSAVLDAVSIAIVDQAVEDQAAADQANAANAENAANAAQAAVNTVNTAQAELDVATKTADDIAVSLNQAERDLIQLDGAETRDNTAIEIAGNRLYNLARQLDHAREIVVSFKKSFQDALCNAAAATQVYALNMSTNVKKMINAVSNAPSAQSAVDAAQLAVDAATTADKYATQYSDFVTYIVNIPIPEKGRGMMGMMATSMGGGQMPIIDRCALARAKAIAAATRAADINAALQNATNYYNIALAVTDKYNLE